MVTNLIQLLHTTAAYQAAAFQLMVAQANVTAKQLGLQEPLPLVVSANINNAVVSMPFQGVGGEVTTSNYVYAFRHGHLICIRRRNGKIITGAANSEQKDIADTNSAHLLAVKDLAALGVDVSAIEGRVPAKISETGSIGRTTTSNAKTSESAQLLRQFELTWQARIQMNLSEKGVLFCWIRDESLFTNAPLQLTNAIALLSPTPAPVEFVKKLFGGPEAYDTVASPDLTEAVLLSADEDLSLKLVALQYQRLTKLKPLTAKKISNALLDFDTYEWTAVKMCAPNYRLGLRFTRGKDVVKVLFCFDCDMLCINHKDFQGGENIDFAHNKLIKLAKDIFPHDSAIQGLKPIDEKEAREEFESSIKSYEQN